MHKLEHVRISRENNKTIQNKQTKQKYIFIQHSTDTGVKYQSYTLRISQL